MIRGVPGAGKSMVAQELRRRLGSDVKILDLDKYAPDNETPNFERSLEEVMSSSIIIGELQSGLWHTTDSIRWIGRFKGTYEIASFILDVSLDLGYQNACDPRHVSSHPSSLDQYRKSYEKFYDRVKEDVFAKSAGLEETRINAEDCNWGRIALEILSAVGM